MVARLTLTAVVFVFALLASSRDAGAYPQFQFSSGTTRCGQCHFSPSGGTPASSRPHDEISVPPDGEK